MQRCAACLQCPTDRPGAESQGRPKQPTNAWSAHPDAPHRSRADSGEPGQATGRRPVDSHLLGARPHVPELCAPFRGFVASWGPAWSLLAKHWRSPSIPAPRSGPQSGSHRLKARGGSGHCLAVGAGTQETTLRDESSNASRSARPRSRSGGASCCSCLRPIRGRTRGDELRSLSDPARRARVDPLGRPGGGLAWPSLDSGCTPSASRTEQRTAKKRPFAARMVCK
jgi:hypothetical protein